MKLLKPKNNKMVRKATKQIADHYARMFSAIAEQEGLTTISGVRDLILAMSVDEFCDYVFLDPSALSAGSAAEETIDDVVEEGCEDDL